MQMCSEATVSLGLRLSANNTINQDGYRQLLPEVKDPPRGRSAVSIQLTAIERIYMQDTQSQDLLFFLL